MSQRRFSPQKRRSNIIDPKLVVIATEGECTELQYFEELQIRKGKANIHVEVLPTEDTKSSPSYVLARLDSFKTKYSIKTNRDELWMVIDFDRWGDSKLAEIARLCLQKGYHLAVSNPCFEIWLLFHHRSLQHLSKQQILALQENKRIGKRTAIQREIIRACGEYQKSNLNFSLFEPHVERAIVEAKTNDASDKRWPQMLGTHVYKLVEKIINPPYL